MAAKLKCSQVTLNKLLHLVPLPVLYALGALLAIWLLTFAFRPARRRRVMDPVAEMKLTLGCSQAQAEALLREYQGDGARAMMDVKSGRKALPILAASQEGWAIMLGPDEVKEPLTMAKLLAQVGQIPEGEALKLIHPGSGGLLAQGLDEELATAFHAVLKERKIQSFVLPVKELPQPLFGGDLLSFSMDAEGTILHLRGGANQRVPWPDVLLLCVGVLKPDSKPSPDGTVAAERHGLPSGLSGTGGVPERSAKTSASNVR